MKEPLISVIIPVYKVEQYLDRCMSGLLNQTYKNLEIILVDDGSPDRCGDMCNRYAAQDKRIMVIHKENGGLSDARNAALDVMQGDYVAFADSDDYFSDFYIENLYKALERTGAEAAVSCFETVWEGDSPKSHPCSVDESSVLADLPETCLSKILYQNSGIEISAWGKLYRAELFSGIRYPKGMLYEDIPVTPQVLLRCKRIAVIPNIDYYYCQRKNSIRSNTFNMKKLDAVRNTRELLEFIIMQYPSLRLAAECRHFSTVCNILFHIRSREFPGVQKELWKEIVKYRRDILFDPNGRKKARIGALLSYSGYHIMNIIYSLFIVR